MVTSAFIWGLGDLTAQRLETRHREQPEKQMQWRRFALQTTYASCVWTPIASKWYCAVDQLARRFARPRTIKFVACKLGFETVGLHPFSLAAYFACLGLGQGRGWASTQSKVARDYWPTLLFEVALWTPLDVILFAFVPVHYQLLATDLGCFAESTVLSWVNAHGVASLLENPRNL
mmetsp:Transcript_42906/g.97050  ORF Transcript_42906/g.97050 Transcript_42906/m.97050 type:complete len:176 (-) Transcript_42906:365-892(-)